MNTGKRTASEHGSTARVHLDEVKRASVELMFLYAAFAVGSSATFYKRRRYPLTAEVRSPRS
jgi:hypothetical protein